MILIHAMHIYGSTDTQSTIFAGIVEFFGDPPAAPTFMVLMGIFFIYSNKGSTKQSVYRGINILLLALVLNLVRGVIPHYIITELWGIEFIKCIPEINFEYILFNVDILTFAGFAYIFMALVYHISKKPITWLILAVLIALLSPLFMENP